MSEVNPKLLTVDFNNSIIPSQGNKKTSSFAALYLGNSAAPVPWKTDQYRSPWDTIEESHLKGMNFFFTLNIDPSIEWYENTKKCQIPKVLLFFEKMKIRQLISRYVIIYEWGTKGKSHGKLHYHGFIKTKQKNELLEEFYKEFNNKTNARHRTIQLSVNKSVKDRENRIRYLRKESQNKIKCLYWN